jgi:hypothetical protein
MLSGKDYRGMPQNALDFLHELVTAWVPISMRGVGSVVRQIPEVGKPLSKAMDFIDKNTNKDINAYETFLSAMGIGVSRYSPTTTMYDKVNDWKKKNGIVVDEGVYPPSKFRDMRNALQDQADGDAVQHWQDLLDQTKLSPGVLQQHFHQSLFRPIAGSLANDIKFKKSLDAEGKLMYDAAQKDRERIWQNFQKMLSQKAWIQNKAAPTAP